jgi:molybdopterin synthase catalytic subunit
MAVVDVLYFSGLRLALGIDRERAELPSGADAAELLRLISDRHPAQAAAIRGARLAVDQAFASGVVELREGAEVAVITPVSGG